MGLYILERFQAPFCNIGFPYNSREPKVTSTVFDADHKKVLQLTAFVDHWENQRMAGEVAQLLNFFSFHESAIMAMPPYKTPQEITDFINKLEGKEVK